jgi:competence protein ComEC
VMLVDTGPAPAPLAACLARVGIDHIDLLVLTHFDLDHVGGAAAVTGIVGTVLHGPAYSDGDRILGGLREGGARVLQAHAGMTGSVGRADWRVLWPRLQSRGFPFGNDASVIVDVRGGDVPTALFLGDLSATPQRALAASAALQPPYTVVKVAHHGSADQDAALYRQVAPMIAVVTVGLENDYGHPRDETLAILNEVGARVMRTDLDGIVAVSPAGDGWELWRERASSVGAGG